VTPLLEPPNADVLATDAGRLRVVVARLARLLRQQDDSGVGPTVHAALVTVETRGPLTLGELAAREQVAPPSITKVVEKLVAAGWVAREVDPDDRRVCRVSITRQGRRHLEADRRRRTEWLAERMSALDAHDVATLSAAIEVLERLAAVPVVGPVAGPVVGAAVIGAAGR
jgi:DNA-binding MarR family transcriptional regulator